ncbi:HAAS signaling domain-containing protein [Paractinoplanes durhamensis]|uniref:HAAS signaling domain-containing protein n=1 Tax=Paractinoplanes durhamensis TaxID=113563 RepID=UPI00362B85D5
MNTTAQDEIRDYVEAVRQALAGLSAETREELLEDLPEHLAEVRAEGSGTLRDRLGSPRRTPLSCAPPPAWSATSRSRRSRASRI